LVGTEDDSSECGVSIRKERAWKVKRMQLDATFFEDGYS
jgi:hypothetical protein